VAWLKARGLDSASRVGERLRLKRAGKTPSESALGQLIEGVLVQAPEQLVDALGELGDGRIALVADEGSAVAGGLDIACRQWCRGRWRSAVCWPACTRPKTWSRRVRCRASLGEGDSVITPRG
jgi:chromosome segregation protein